ncbi:acyl--CoA ligase [Sedimentimonas flavescens]|uniref:Acyl--CoA ligase n=1 Tax=Sedimentimonas flavescens TaxID=2851012 RepID=A0ABT3A078_9RHOB|nr:class I adenylate-forming enzyme family protein [Sedimentimonas flavescens]MCV2879402.1 acyl--CoA ligase [Sedimentimonas flavescens]
MTQQHNVGLAFLKRAETMPQIDAILGEDYCLRYGEMHALVLSTAQHLQKHGIEQGDLIMVRSQDPVFVMVTIFASALLGCRWVFGREKLLKDPRISPDLVLQTDDEPLLPKGIRVDESWGRPPEDAGRLQFPGYRDPEDDFMLNMTSGTTGTPKIVVLSQRIIMDRTLANRQWFGHPGASIVSLFPMGAPAYLSRLISALILGGRVVASYDPEFWLKEEVDLVVGSPIQLHRLFERRDLPRKLPLVHTSGGRPPEGLVRKLLDRFERVASGYGSTEGHNVLSTYFSLTEDGSITAKTVIRDVELELVEEDGRKVPPGREGIVRIRNGYLAKGYLGTPEAQTRAFRDGWFYPGDLGRWNPDGTFIVTGRLNEQFNIGGVKINAQLLDHAMLEVAGVRDVISFLMPRDDRPDRLTALVAIEPGADPSSVIGDLRLAAIVAVGRDGVPERFFFADTLPRTLTGKPDRAGCIAYLQRSRATAQAQRTAPNEAHQG